MDEATTRRRAPSPSNTRKFVEADARSTDLLPKSSRSHARRPSTNFLQVRDEPEFILHDLAGPYPVQNSPSTPGSAAHPVQNSPSKRPWQAHPVQNSPSKRPWQAHPVQNSPSTPGSTAHPVQNSPSKPQNADFGPLFACRETLYRFRHQHDKQGELYPACGAASGTKLSQQAALAGPPGTKLSQRARLGGPPGTKLSQQAPKRRFRPTFRMQGELFTASATNNPSREKKVTHQHPTAPNNVPLPKFRMQFD